MRPEGKSNARQRKKADKSTNDEQKIVKNDAVANVDEKEAKQKKQ